ncbi:AAA family ATPase, partial [Streptomyces mirabilis]|uniref:AAA family ATPase n=1 Tax=Streptomyces mirabilis TaxID=68239 RepID=UPI0036C5F8EF
MIATAPRHLRTSAVGLTLGGGLPGSGKSTLSGAPADRLGVTLLSSDRVRKELAGIPAEESASARYGEGLYTPEWTDKTYAALLDRASALLADGESVVLDAAWTGARRRAATLRMAEQAGADLVALHCQVPGDVAATRPTTPRIRSNRRRPRRGRPQGGPSTPPGRSPRHPHPHPPRGPARPGPGRPSPQPP